MRKKPPVPKTGTRRTKNQKYLAQREAIAPYVARELLRKSPVRSNPTEWQKRRVRDYYNLLIGPPGDRGRAATVAYPIGIGDIPAKAGKTRKEREARLEKLKQEHGQPDLKYLNVALIPSVLTKSGKVKKPRITYRADAPNKIAINHVEKETELFDQRTLIKGSDAEIAAHVLDTTNKLPAGPDTTYHVQCGEHLIRTPISKREIGAYVVHLKNKYDVRGKGNFRYWLNGVTAQTAIEQDGLEELYRDFDESRKRHKAAKRAKLRKKGKTHK